MRTTKRMRWTAGLLVAVMGFGCNPLTLPYFVLFGIDDKVPPEFKLASNPKKPTHVLILTSVTTESQAELLGVERLLGNAVVKRLEADCTANKEKVVIVPVYKAEEFKANNPGWRTMPAHDIGKRFDVDYVVQIEVASMSLYDKGSRKTLFAGRAAMNVSVFDMAKLPNEGPVHEKRLTVEYPRTGRPVLVDEETNVEKFRQMFLQATAQKVSWQLTSHISTAEYMQD